MADSEHLQTLFDNPVAIDRIYNASGDAYYYTGTKTALGQGWRRLGAENDPTYTGWKIHVSASTKDAMIALTKLAMDYKIGKFKFAGDTLLKEFLNPHNPQSGKTAVFYHSEKGVDGKPIDWQAFVHEADRIVEALGGPGPAVQRDKEMPGTKAVYYRNVRGADDEDYVPRADITMYGKARGIGETELFNPSGEKDPFAHFSADPSRRIKRTPPGADKQP